MEKLVYFPTFEPPTSNWLKFALLYMDDFSPIIPDGKYKNLSKEYMDILNETELIKPTNPQLHQGEAASIKSIRFLNDVTGEPYVYSPMFNKVNILPKLRNSQARNFKIYNEKFSTTWKNYCLEQNFATETKDGILVAEELAFIYMSFLADEIAYEEGKSIITDNRKFDSYLGFQRLRPITPLSKFNLAQGVISLSVPRNLSEISVSKLIDFRNEKSKLRKAFNLELNKALDGFQNEIKDRDFIKRYDEIYSEFTSEILGQGLGIAPIPIQMSILVNNILTSNHEYAVTILTALSLAITAKNAIGGRWKEIATKHNTKRYLVNLNRLN